MGAWEGVSEHSVVPLEFAVDQVEYAALFGMYFAVEYVSVW